MMEHQQQPPGALGPAIQPHRLQHPARAEATAASSALSAACAGTARSAAPSRAPTSIRRRQLAASTAPRGSTCNEPPSAAS